MLRLIVCASLLLSAPAGAFAASRLNFERTIPARQDLGGIDDLAITYVIADNDRVATFVDVFLDLTNRSGLLRVHDETSVDQPTIRKGKGKAMRRIEQRIPADAFLRITAFTCTASAKSGEGSSYDVDGKRVKRVRRWYDGMCIAHIDAISKATKKKIREIVTGGEGTSPRVEELTQEDRDIALDQAARFAAVKAAEEITPRKVRESIALVENAPAFEDGMVHVDADRFEEARKVWESALVANPRSAGLELNLAAVCEAMGDIKTAERHYEAAHRFAPDDARYRFERDSFRHRYGLKR
jgi:tetratricopeptide (TPR) repeat protein